MNHETPRVRHPGGELHHVFGDERVLGSGESGQRADDYSIQSRRGLNLPERVVERGPKAAVTGCVAEALRARELANLRRSGDFTHRSLREELLGGSTAC